MSTTSVPLRVIAPRSVSSSKPREPTWALILSWQREFVRIRSNSMDLATDVLVVGAGPVGLMMAAELSRHGVKCRVIDKLVEPMAWVKAIGVSQRTLEVFDHIGIITEALDTGMDLRRLRVYVNRQQAMDADAAYPDEAPYKYALSLPQPETERILTAHLATFGVSVERGVELRTFKESGNGVQASLGSQDHSSELHCRYLVGCDGAHSTVRHILQLAFEGGRFPVEFLLADVALDWDIEHSTSCLFLDVNNDTLENLLVCIPYRDRLAAGQRRYRLSTMSKPVSAVNWEKPPSSETEPRPNPTLDEVHALLQHFVPVPVQASDLRWSSVFRISHRIVPCYRSGRAFLAGDAAHIHPPTGGQGMNTGLQDAFNLAWKLALAIKGNAHSELLDSFNAERQPVGQAVVTRTQQRSLSIQDRSQHDPDALREDSQLLVNYRSSRWVCEHLSGSDALQGGPQPGDRAPDVEGLHRDGQALRLFDLFRGIHHTVLVYRSAAADADALERIVQDMHSRFDGLVKAYLVIAPGTTITGSTASPVIVDADRRFQSKYAVKNAAIYIVRPDGHIGFRTDLLSAQALSEYLGRIFRVTSPGL